MPTTSTSTCEYCQQERTPMEIMGYTIGYEPCTCAAAQAAAEEARREETLRKEEEARVAKLNRYRRAGIRKRFMTAETERSDLVQRVLAGESLYIYGKVSGSGKTYLASAIAKQLIDHGKRVVFLTSLEALEKIRSTYDGDQSEAEVIRRLCTCEVLVLDDLGKESQKNLNFLSTFS